MPVSFPATKRYFVTFRNSDIGLTPVFTYYKRADTFANLTAPSFTELSNGTYYFSASFTTASDPDVIFQVDGGASIPTEEVRYQTGMASPKDLFLDEPVSVVVSDVWNDVVDRAAGTKGDFIESIGAPADTSAVASLFGKALLYKESVRGDGVGLNDGNSVKQVYDRVGAPVGASISADIANSITSIKGADSRDLTQLAGAAFVPATDNLHEIALDADAAATSSAAAPTAAAIASAIWNELIADPSYTTLGSAAVILKARALETTAQAIKAKTDNLPADTDTDLSLVSENLTRALGLMHENSVLDQTVFDGDNNLTAARFRLYDSQANALAAGMTGLVATYTITASYTGGNLTNYTVVQEP